MLPFRLLIRLLLVSREFVVGRIHVTYEPVLERLTAVADVVVERVCPAVDPQSVGKVRPVAFFRVAAAAEEYRRVLYAVRRGKYFRFVIGVYRAESVGRKNLLPFGYKPVKENFGLLFDVGVFADSHAEKVRVVDLLAAHFRFVAVTVARIVVFL